MKPKPKPKPCKPEPRKPPLSPGEVLILDHLVRIEKFLVETFEHIHKEVRNIMATQAELAADLQAVTDQVTKIGTETTATLQKVTDLEAALAAGGGTTPEVDAAMAALKAQVKVVDDLVADATA